MNHTCVKPVDVKKVLVCVFSEGFIEVSEDEFKEENEDASLVITRKTSPSGVHKDRTKKEEKPEESVTPVTALRLEEEEDKMRQNEETETEEKTESSSTPATNEWGHLDMVSISVYMEQPLS